MTTIIQIIGLTLNKNIDKIQPFHSLESDLQIDSIDRLDLIFRLENLFGKELSSDEISSIYTVEDLCTVFDSGVTV